jgi:hypothetical protein
MDVVGYVQRPWGIHMDIVRNREVREWTDVPLQYAHLCSGKSSPVSDRQSLQEVRNT